MVEAGLIAGFWRVVEDCLVQFHRTPREQASALVTELLARLRDRREPAEAPASLDPIYHEEPWYIACNLANSQLPLKSSWQDYQAVVARHGLSRERRSIDIARHF